jgi:ABC-type oligopeptide transport system substrate-binding subunit
MAAGLLIIFAAGFVFGLQADTTTSPDLPGRVITGWDDKGQPVVKTSLIVHRSHLSSPLQSLDPAMSSDTTSASILANVYEGLYTYHYLKRPVGHATLIPNLAEAMPEVSQDGLTYTIRLKKGVVYQRNACFGREEHRDKTRPVRAADFVLAFKRCADFHVPPRLGYVMIAGRIEGVEAFRTATREEYAAEDYERFDLDVAGLRAVDDHTLQIKLTKPYPQLPLVLAMHPFAPVPPEAIKHWLDRPGNQEPQFTAPGLLPGTGAFRIDAANDSRIVLVRNPDYRSETYPSEGEGAHDDYPGDEALGLLEDAGKTMPFIDVVVYDIVPDYGHSWRALTDGRIDARGILTQKIEEVLSPQRRLRESWAERGFYLRKSLSPTLYWIAFNMDDPVVGASRSLRQAICLAFDTRAHIDRVYGGRGRPAVNIIPHGLDGHEQAGPGSYYVPHTPQNRERILARAKAKLADARKELAAAGALSDGRIPTLQLEMSAGRISSEMGDFVREQLAAIGLEATTVANDWATLQKKVTDRTAQMFMMGWHADYPDAKNFLQLFYSPNIETGTNNVNYADEQYDAWYAEASQLPPGPRRTQLYVKMSRKISQDVPVLLLSQPAGYLLCNDWLGNCKPHPFPIANLKHYRIDPALRRKLRAQR